jgi:hypothetical protein
MLALAACGEDRSPTQPEAAGAPSPVAASLALASNTWTGKAPYPYLFGSFGLSAIGTVLGGRLFVIVSSGSEQHAYAYDPGTNTWKPRAGPTWGHAAVVRVTLNGQAHLLAVGGYHAPDKNQDDIPNDSELYTR